MFSRISYFPLYAYDDLVNQNGTTMASRRNVSSHISSLISFNVIFLPNLSTSSSTLNTAVGPRRPRVIGCWKEFTLHQNCMILSIIFYEMNEKMIICIEWFLKAHNFMKHIGEKTLWNFMKLYHYSVLFSSRLHVYIKKCIPWNDGYS